MPCYTIQPASRRAYHYNPYNTFFGPPQALNLSPVVPRYSTPFSSPFFRNLEEDFAQFDNFFKEINESVAKAQAQAQAQQKSFQPRFDVKEEPDKFILHGELPGVQAENLSIEFVDRNTMLVKGKVTRQETHGTPPAATAVEQPQQAVEPAKVSPSEEDATMSGAQPESTPSETASVSNYHKASVEDEDAQDTISESGSVTSSSPTPQAPAESEIPSQPEQPPQQEVSKQADQSPESQESHYWLTERTIGSFTRSFRFPGQINQDAVTAKLRDGVLTVDVPKILPQREARRIEVRGF